MRTTTMRVVAVSVAVLLGIAVFGRQPYVSADDSNSGGHETPEAQASRSPGVSGSKTPEPQETEKPQGTENPQKTSEMSESAKNTAEAQKNATEKVAEAQQSVDRLAAAVKAFVGTLPPSVQTSLDLANQKLTLARTMFSAGSFGEVNGQTEAAKSIAEHGLEMLNNESEAKNIRTGLDTEIENEDISSIVISPSASSSGGELHIEHRDRTRTTQMAPVSSASLFQLQTQAGTLGAHIASGSQVVIDNEDLNIQSQLPVSFDIQNKKVFVQIASGSEELKILPAQALAQLNDNQKPTTVQNVVLKQDGDKIVFEASGTRESKFLGFIPVTVSVTTTLDSQTGAVVSVNNPWFLNAFGFLFR